MQYRKDARSGNNLSVLGFGCMRLPGTLAKIDYNKSEQLFLDALAKGINYFDTAYLYPGSEAILGQFIETHQVRDQLYIATKLPMGSCHSGTDFDKFFSEQLSRLRTDTIDYYLIHNISSFAQWEQLCQWGVEEWIQQKKSAGQIKQIGFSFHGPQHDFLKLLDVYDWDFCQIQYNYININYQAGQLGLQKASEKNIPVIIMEPLLGGKLATGLPPKVADLFHKADSTLSPAGWALKWLWNQPEVTVVLSGMNQQEQLNENSQMAEISLPEVMTAEESRMIDKAIDIFNEYDKVSCTGCNYCMPCPQGINIPACFSAYNSSYSMGKWTALRQYTISTGAPTDNPHFASSCIDCGKCEQHCPQDIPIRQSLKSVAKRLEPFWYRGGLSIYRKFSR